MPSVWAAVTFGFLKCGSHSHTHHFCMFLFFSLFHVARATFDTSTCGRHPSCCWIFRVGHIHYISAWLLVWYAFFPRESHQERPYNPEGLKLPDCTDQWMPNPSASFTLTSAMVSMSPLADELNTKNGDKDWGNLDESGMLIFKKAVCDPFFWTSRYLYEMYETYVWCGCGAHYPPTPKNMYNTMFSP